MKDYIPNYLRKKGQPRDFQPSLEIFKIFPEKERNLIDDFVKEIAITFTSKNTLNTAKNSLILLRDVTEKPLQEVGEEEIKGFVRLVNSSGKSRAGRKHIFYMLKRFLEFAGKKELIEIVKSRRETGNGSRINKADLINSKELEALVRAATSLRDKAMITLLWESAARPDELLGLKWGDIIINDDGFAELGLFSGKKKDTRNIIVKDCVLHLRRWKAEYSFLDLNKNDYVFVSKERGKPISSGALLKLIQRIAKKAKIEKNVYPYLFRHSRLTFLRQKLKTPNYIQFAGHTERQASSYTHLDTDDLKAAVLKEVYVTEELEESERTNLKKEIEKLRAEMDNLGTKLMQEMSRRMNLQIKVNPEILQKT